MRNTNTCKLGVILLTLAMLATAFTVLPMQGAGGDKDGNAPTVTYPYVRGKVISLYTSLPLSGVTVTLLNSTWPVAPQTTTSNGEFNFTVEFVRQYNLTFEHPQFKDKEVHMLANLSDWTGIGADLSSIGMIKLSSVSGIVKNRAGSYLGDVKIRVTNTDETSSPSYGETTTSQVGSFTVYINDTTVTDVKVIYNKVGYFESQITYQNLAASVDRNVGTVYLDAIVPTPTVLLFGVVKNNVGGDGIPGVHVSVSRDGVNWISNYTDKQGYYEILTYSGRFKVKAELQGYYTNESWADVPADDMHHLDINITKTPLEFNTLTVTVTDPTPAALTNANVKIYDVAGMYINSADEVGGGVYTVKFYNATFRISVSLDKYFTNSLSTVVWVTGTFAYSKPVVLTKIPNLVNRTLSGRIMVSSNTSTNNYPISGAMVTIFDKNTSHLYSNSTTSLSPNGFYSIRAFTGSFAILVDAPGYQGKLVSATIGNKNATKDIWLEETGVDKIQKSFEFSADWKNVTYRENRTLSVDNGTLRANADIEHGRGLLGLDVNNWDISAGEVTAWTMFMEAQGLPELYTTSYFAFDNLHYELVTDTYAVVISDATGSVETSTEAIRVDIEATYTVIGTVNVNEEHMISLNASYDTETADNVYNVVLPYGYEMTANTTSSGKVKVTGFTTVIADTMNGTGMEKITMTVKMSDNGTAKIRLTDGTFYEKNSTYKGYEVIVRRGDASAFNSTVKFSAMDSTDPVGSIQLANYTWNYGDGSAPGYGMTVTHNYTTAGTFTARLNVTETGGNHTWHNATVHVDEATPTPVIDVLYHAITNNAITVNEDNKTSFTGGNSTDMILGTTAGIVQTWQWSWGDGTANNTVTKGGEANINHTFSEPGTYYVLMNVTDVVDHVSAHKNITVTVKDVTKPTPDYKILNATYAVVTGCRENVSFYFNSTSTDNYYDWQNLTYVWSFGDGTANLTVMNVTHTFVKVGQFNVTLNVTDKAGNWAVKKVPVSISLGIRPDLMLYSTTFKIDPKTIDDGETVKFSVNFTNKGEADATGVTVTFFVRNSDGSNDRISGTVALTNQDGTANSGTLEPKKNATAKLSWKPSGKGNYTIYVTANCTGEHSSTMFDNNNGNILNTYVKVNASPMIQYAIAGVAIGVFIVGAVVYFFWVRGKSAGGFIDDKRKKK